MVSDQKCISFPQMIGYRVKKIDIRLLLRFNGNLDLFKKLREKMSKHLRILPTITASSWKLRIVYHSPFQEFLSVAFILCSWINPRTSVTKATYPLFSQFICTIQSRRFNWHLPIEKSRSMSEVQKSCKIKIRHWRRSTQLQFGRGRGHFTARAYIKAVAEAFYFCSLVGIGSAFHTMSLRPLERFL